MQSPSLPAELNQQNLSDWINGPQGATLSEDVRQSAGNDLRFIFELNQSTAFDWFWRECIEKLFVEARTELHEPDSGPDDLRQAKEQFLALRKVRNWMLEREILRRRQLNLKDPEIYRLTKKLG